MESNGICKSTETFFNFRVWSVTFQFNAVSVVSLGSLSGICKHHLHMGIAQFYIIEDGIFFCKVYAMLSKKKCPSTL